MAKRAVKAKQPSKKQPSKKKTSGAKAVAKHQPAPEPRTVNIFISYATEDKELAAAVENILRVTFAFASLEVWRDAEIKLGANWVSAIDTALETTDVLLVLFTERMKASHSYTGYEIGYFNKSKQQQPQINGRDRIYIPLCVGAEIPETMHYIQGIKIEKDDVVKIIKTSASDLKATELGKDHPLYRLLDRISGLVAPITEKRDDVAKLISGSAHDLYKSIHEYLENRISSETFPERKIVIRTDTTPAVGDDGADLTKSTFEFIGKSFDIFGVPESASREFTWEELNARLEEPAATYMQGLRRLVGDVIQKTGENYFAVTTKSRDKAFRLFVSKISSFVNKKTEIHIYFVEMRSKRYGDQLTTQLLEAMSVGLRFRFLVLEEESEFRADRLGYVTMEEKDLKPRVGELLVQMDLITRDADAANLRDPDFLELIWGKGRESEQVVKDMLDTWTKARDELYATARAILSPDTVPFAQRKVRFVAALEQFSEWTEEMNREYTSRTMTILKSMIEKKLEKQLIIPDKARSPRPAGFAL
jgi:hypothetical protein